MASTTPTPTAFFDFVGLRPELRLMIFEELENNDLCNMRLISRQLFGETNEEFGKRFLNKIKILGKVSKVKQIHDILRHPFMAQSKLRIRELRVDYPTPVDLAIEHRVVVEDWLPSEELARHLLNAIPKSRSTIQTTEKKLNSTASTKSPRKIRPLPRSSCLRSAT